MIPIRCGTCGTDNAPGSRFCGGCGARLDASGPVTVPPASATAGSPSGPPSGPIHVGPVGPPSVPPGAVGMAGHGPSSVPPIAAMPMVPPVSANRPSSVPTPVIAVAAPSTVRPVPAGPKSVPPGTSGPRVKAPAPAPATSTGPGVESVPAAVRRRASERLNSGGAPQLSSGSVIGMAPGRGRRRKVPWLLLAVDVAMIVGGALFLRAALAREEVAAGAPGAGSATGAGSGSSAAVVMPAEPDPVVPAPATAPASPSAPEKPNDVKATLRGSMKGGGGSSNSSSSSSSGGGGGGDLLSGISKGSGSNSAGSSNSGSSSSSSSGSSSSSSGGSSSSNSGSSSSSGSGSAAATGSGTVDPYPVDTEPEASLATQVDRQSARSQAKFERCYTQATKALPAEQALIGDVEIAFQVLATGETRNAAVVSDTTGSAELGRCLLAVIATWQFETGGAGPTDFVRPFHFSGK